MDWTYLLIERLVGIARREAKDRHYQVADRLAVLRSALESGEDVRLVYFSASSRQFTERVVTPLRLAQEHAGDWYLRGFDNLRGAERTFKVGRIKEVAPVADLAGRPVRVSIRSAWYSPSLAPLLPPFHCSLARNRAPRQPSERLRQLPRRVSGGS
jgi:predicted DNA-binding transcriptional regulator YafY